LLDWEAAGNGFSSSKTEAELITLLETDSDALWGRSSLSDSRPKMQISALSPLSELSLLGPDLLGGLTSRFLSVHISCKSGGGDPGFSNLGLEGKLGAPEDEGDACGPVEEGPICWLPQRNPPSSDEIEVRRCIAV